MYYDIVEEYRVLLVEKKDIENTLDSFPKGYLYKKKSGNNEYVYLKYRNGSTVESTYIKSEEVNLVELKLQHRKEKEERLPQIIKRLRDIEKAAEYLSTPLSRKLNILKLSIPMDGISDDKKSLSLSFSDAMLSIEGVPVTVRVSSGFNEWENGNKTFSELFQETLKHYGFLVEV